MTPKREQRPGTARHRGLQEAKAPPDGHCGRSERLVPAACRQDPGEVERRHAPPEHEGAVHQGEDDGESAEGAGRRPRATPVKEDPGADRGPGLDPGAQPEEHGGEASAPPSDLDGGQGHQETEQQLLGVVREHRLVEEPAEDDDRADDPLRPPDGREAKRSGTSCDRQRQRADQQALQRRGRRPDRAFG